MYIYINLRLARLGRRRGHKLRQGGGALVAEVRMETFGELPFWVRCQEYGDLEKVADWQVAGSPLNCCEQFSVAVQSNRRQYGSIHTTSQAS